MKRLLLFLPFLLSCGLLHRGEISPPHLKSTQSASDCTFPDWKETFDAKKISIEKVNALSDCAEKNIDKGFTKLKGQKPDELSYSEIKQLVEKKIIDLGIKKERQWLLVETALKLFHPEGKSIITKSTLTTFLSRFRRQTPTLVRLIQETSQSRSNLSWFWTETGWGFIDDFSAILSPHFSLSLTTSKDLVRVLLYEINSQPSRPPKKELATIYDEIEAFWILKHLLIPDTDDSGLRGNISGEAIIRLFRLGTSLARTIPASIHWIDNQALPQNIPCNLPEETTNFSTQLIRFFTENTFVSIDREQLAWAIRKLDPHSKLYELSGEVVRLSQRLEKTERHTGMHPASYLTLIERLPTLAQSFLTSAAAFPVCRPSPLTFEDDCHVTLRKALEHPLLSKIALKGSNYIYRRATIPETALPKRLDYFIPWEEVLIRLAERTVMTRLFETFDLENKHHGQMPLSGNSDKDLKETLDLAYTFLRFASNQQNNKSSTQEEEPLSNAVVVKPGALYRVMGLIGDRWMPDGNSDNFLDADEFFSITQVYDAITRTANSLSWPSGPVPYYPWAQDLIFTEFGRLINYDSSLVIFERRKYIENVKLDWHLPAIQSSALKLPATTLQNLFHALIGNSPQDPLRAVPFWGRTPPVTLLHYVGRDVALPIAAITSMLDRIMIKCDRDEDDKLNWLELDCAMPLILNTASQTLASGLINLDPGVQDGSQILLEFLQAPGIRLSIAKLLAINGSVERFSLRENYPLLERWIRERASASFEDIAFFIGATKSGTSESIAPWVYEAKKRFGKCDANPKDGFIRGQWEFTCFTDTVLKQVLDTLAQLTHVPAASLVKFIPLTTLEPIRTGLVLSVQKEGDLNELLTNEIPIYSDPGKILSLIENVVRRAPENALQPNDTEEIR